MIYYVYMRTPLQFLQRESNKLDIAMEKAAGFMPGGHITAAQNEAERLRHTEPREIDTKSAELLDKWYQLLGGIGPVNQANLLFNQLGLDVPTATGNNNAALINLLSGPGGQDILKLVQEYSDAHPLKTDDVSGITYETVQLPDGHVVVSPIPVNKANGTMQDPISGLMELRKAQAQMEGEAMTSDQVNAILDRARMPGYDPFEYNGRTPYELSSGYQPEQGKQLKPEEYESMAAANLLSGAGLSAAKDWYMNATPQEREAVLEGTPNVSYNGRRMRWDDALKLEAQRLQQNKPQQAAKLTQQQWLEQQHPNYKSLKALNEYAGNAFKKQLEPAMSAFRNKSTELFPWYSSMLVNPVFGALVGKGRINHISEEDAYRLLGAGAKQVQQTKPTLGSMWDNTAGSKINNFAEHMRGSRYLPDWLSTGQVFDNNTWYGALGNAGIGLINPIGTAADLPSYFVEGAGTVLGAAPHVFGEIANKKNLDDNSRAYTGSNTGRSPWAINSQFQQTGDVNNPMTHYGIGAAADAADGALTAYLMYKGGAKAKQGFNSLRSGRFGKNFAARPVRSLLRAAWAPVNVEYPSFSPVIGKTALELRTTPVRNPASENLGENIYQSPYGSAEQGIKRYGIKSFKPRTGQPIHWNMVDADPVNIL